MNEATVFQGNTSRTPCRGFSLQKPVRGWSQTRGSQILKQMREPFDYSSHLLLLSEHFLLEKKKKTEKINRTNLDCKQFSLELFLFFHVFHCTFQVGDNYSHDQVSKNERSDGDK